ncbi:MAG: ABC transporter ATP-binding protein [Chitinophagaceae bacterium]|nr:ABC transporter ATP-binding protein [Chitinophagaceae bacterium]
MSNTVIKVENLSKQYRLGQVSTGTISHDLNRWWHSVRGKEDPYLKIGEANDRTQKGSSEYVWALRDINFSVKHGEVLGIVGKNGAGKSTLLKILSRTTSPTTGIVKIKGRVASLLEVGTGFHPELSGRENIFLNGAILGMTKKEIKQKFDEIVDFAGVERYIDTPVKRYSSGMYVRLAFAVAAHLEPEILIVDEVLAVGDAEFQKKCLGKMKDVSEKDGRTVLFVSHNMEAIQNLCTHAILINQGKVTIDGTVSQVVKGYLQEFVSTRSFVEFAESEAPGTEQVKCLMAGITPAAGATKEYFTTSDTIKFEFRFKLTQESPQQLDVTFHLVDERGILIYVGSTIWDHEVVVNNGYLFATCIFPGNILNEGNYSISRLLVVQNKGNVIAEFKDLVSFDMAPVQREGYLGWVGQKEGVLKLDNVKWSLVND